MRRLGASLSAVLAGVVFAAPAAADPAPFDPHVPIPLLGWCPGGSHVADTLAFCEGVSYPDGTRWNMYRVGFVAWQPMRCIIADSGMMPAPAPPGGCGGGWQG